MENHSEERPASVDNGDHADNAVINQNQSPGATNSDEGEFKLKIRKLEMPVRPRGVLAE